MIYLSRSYRILHREGKRWARSSHHPPDGWDHTRSGQICRTWGVNNKVIRITFSPTGTNLCKNEEQPLPSKPYNKRHTLGSCVYAPLVKLVLGLSTRSDTEDVVCMFPTLMGVTLPSQAKAERQKRAALQTQRSVTETQNWDTNRKGRVHKL